MTLTEVSRFQNKEPGRGFIYTGIYNIEMTGYTNGTGFTVDASALGLKRLLQVCVQSVDCANGTNFDWDPATGTLKAYVAAGTEVLTNGLDGKNARIMYWGF